MKKLVGHQQIRQRLEVALSRSRLPSTFLFVGESGIGKKTFAHEFSKSLLCQTTGESELAYCDDCESCSLFDANNHPDFDVVRKSKDRAFLQIEQFIGDREHRNQRGLCHHLSLTPFHGGRKIAVIEDGDFFNQEIANCLLKTLEEPPPNSVLIIIGTSAQKQLPTIRSRSQVIHFHPLKESEVLQVLTNMNDVVVSDPLPVVAKNAQGSLDILKQYEVEGLFEFRNTFLMKLASGSPSDGGFAKEVIGFVDQAGKDSAPRRDRIRRLADFAIEFFQLLAQRCFDFGNGSLDSVLENALTDGQLNWNSGVDSITDSIERCMDVHLQVSANANQATLIESWLSDLGKLARGEEIYFSIKTRFAY